MGKIGAKEYRVKSKMVHMSLLRGIKETTILMNSTSEILKKGHDDKSLPFASIIIDKTYIFYIPTWMLKTVINVQELGVVRVIAFLKYLNKNRLERFMKHDFDWGSYDLNQWKKN